MADEIVSLHGDTLEGEPDPEIIERIENLLERAKVGEITGVAFAVTHPGGSAGTGWSLIYGNSFSLAGAIAMLQHRYAEALLSED